MLRVPFRHLMYIDSVSNNEKSGEHPKCPWKYQFCLETEDRKYLLFSRNEEEHFLWLTAFYRIAKVEVIDMSYQPSLDILKIYDH